MRGIEKFICCIVFLLITIDLFMICKAANFYYATVADQDTTNGTFSEDEILQKRALNAQLCFAPGSGSGQGTRPGNQC